MDIDLLVRICNLQGVEKPEQEEPQALKAGDYAVASAIGVY